MKKESQKKHENRAKALHLYLKQKQGKKQGKRKADEEKIKKKGKQKRQLYLMQKRSGKAIKKKKKTEKKGKIMKAEMNYVSPIPDAFSLAFFFTFT